MSDKPPVIEMSEGVLHAIDACQAALTAVNEALATSSRLGIATFGFQPLMAVRPHLDAVINPHGPAAVLARNEIATWRQTNGEQS